MSADEQLPEIETQHTEPVEQFVSKAVEHHDSEAAGVDTMFTLVEAKGTRSTRLMRAGMVSALAAHIALFAAMDPRAARETAAAAGRTCTDTARSVRKVMRGEDEHTREYKAQLRELARTRDFDSVDQGSLYLEADYAENGLTRVEVERARKKLDALTAAFKEELRLNPDPQRLLHDMIQEQGRYVRSHSSMTDTLLDGGNCEGRAKLMLALEQRVLGPGHGSIQVYSDHVRMLTNVDGRSFAIEKPSLFPVEPKDVDGTRVLPGTAFVEGYVAALQERELTSRDAGARFGAISSGADRSGSAKGADTSVAGIRVAPGYETDSPLRLPGTDEKGAPLRVSSPTLPPPEEIEDKRIPYEEAQDELIRQHKIEPALVFFAPKVEKSDEIETAEKQRPRVLEFMRSIDGMQIWVPICSAIQRSYGKEMLPMLADYALLKGSDRARSENLSPRAAVHPFSVRFNSQDQAEFSFRIIQGLPEKKLFGEHTGNAVFVLHVPVPDGVPLGYEYRFGPGEANMEQTATYAEHFFERLSAQTTPAATEQLTRGHSLIDMETLAKQHDGGE